MDEGLFGRGQIGWLADNVARALDGGLGIVALESTVIAHGLPFPINYDTALACQQAVTEAGAVPATIGVVGGVPKIGLTEDELRQFASGRAPDGSKIEKVTLNNLAAVMMQGGWGATTVAGSMRIATLGGRPFDEIPRPLVFSTGGIGGVHRGVVDTFDMSADLTALAQLQIVCVASGAKSILDLPKTVEYLEQMGIPIAGYKSDEFPAFYSSKSGLEVTVKVETAQEAAELAYLHWTSGGRGAVLVAVPIPDEFDLPASDMESAVSQAIEKALRLGIRGKALTPFLLKEMAEISSGKTLGANRALLTNNASVAASIAKALTEVIRHSPVGQGPT
jgi:pseudouridine-5'-phosphate glycosidase